ncbi:7440_t:CDS:2 [Dentiscutata erythropus]|uniref:7440_t:CDS:1 n=1 Tax=Dentiscutata erythropus TaxID=1348616 RepID=A0A9N9P1S6_9GLOM|nr:7440_t:CDS:2 [Dentiscutata erythropus]
MAAPVGILRNANQTQQGKSTIVAPFSDSDSEQEGINSTDYGQEYETEPEGELNTEEAQETLQHETLVKAGYLAKRQERRKVGNKNWKKRWFVLRSTKLAYYKSEKEYELLKILDLNDIHAVAEVKVKNRSNVFGIVTPKRTFYVQAERKKTKRLTIQLKSKISAPVLDKQTIKTSVKETSAIDIPNSQVQTTEHGEGGNSYVSVSSFTSGGSIPNVSSQPSSPVAANFVPERKDSSDPTASSEEEEGGPVDVTGENNNDGREIQKGYLYKLDRYKATWKKRWFVLDNEKLAYYKDPKDHRPHLNLNLSDILDAIETDSSPYKSRQHCFKIITPKRTYICSAPDETSLVTWLAALQVALTKTKEKLKAES